MRKVAMAAGIICFCREFLPRLPSDHSAVCIDGIIIERRLSRDAIIFG